MTDVAADVNAEAASDGSRVGIEWSRSSEQLSASEDDVITFPHHAVDWTGSRIIDERREEFFLREVGIVLLEHGLAWLAKLHGDQFKSSLFEFLHNLSDESSLHSVRFYHYVSSFFHRILLLIFLVSLVLSFFPSLILLLVSTFLFPLFTSILLLLCYLLLREENLVIGVEVNGCTSRFGILSCTLRSTI